MIKKMAYTKIHPIKSTVNAAIAYILNPEKTDNSILVTSFACTSQTAGTEFEYTRKLYNANIENLAYHCIQSFKPDEVTAEQAHRIGIRTADELLKGQYEYVLTTHTDRGHIHNHLIINGVNFANGLAFGTEHDRKSNPAWKELRKISDEICIENSLSVIELPEKGYGKCYYEWVKDKQHSSYKSKLREAIDKCIISADDFEDFLEKMKNEMGYESKLRGETLSFRAAEQERFTRCSKRNFGWYYEPSQIKKRIERQVRKRSASVTKNNGFYSLNNNDSVGLNRWAALKNMQEASRLINSLSEYGVNSIEQLDEKISDRFDRRYDTVDDLRKLENEIKNQRELLKMLNTYWDNKAAHDKYIKAQNKKHFEREHNRELTLYSSSKEWLKKKFGDKALPNRVVLESKISEKENEYEAMLEKYHNLKKEIKSLNNAREKIDEYMKLQEQNKNKSKGELE